MAKDEHEAPPIKYETFVIFPYKDLHEAKELIPHNNQHFSVDDFRVMEYLEEGQRQGKPKRYFLYSPREGVVTDTRGCFISRDNPLRGARQALELLLAFSEEV